VGESLGDLGKGEAEAAEAFDGVIGRHLVAGIDAKPDFVSITE
jgi:hypothetical protein